MYTAYVTPKEFQQISEACLLEGYDNPEACRRIKLIFFNLIMKNKVSGDNPEIIMKTIGTPLAPEVKLIVEKED